MSRILLNSELLIKRIALTAIFLIVSATGIFGQAKTEPELRSLPTGQAIERQMKGADKHLYKLTLKADEFLQLTIEQKGIGVSLKLLDASKKTLATMDNQKNTKESEVLSFIASAAGEYILEVSGVGEKAAQGNYIIRRTEARKATAQDRQKIEAEKPNAVSFAGTWLIVVTTRQGDLQFTLILKQENEKLSGSVQSPYGEGKVTGSAIDGSIKLDIVSEPIEVKFKGTLDGDKIKGAVTSNIPNTGELPCVGTRSN